MIICPICSRMLKPLTEASWTCPRCGEITLQTFEAVKFNREHQAANASALKRLDEITKPTSE